MKVTLSVVGVAGVIAAVALTGTACSKDSSSSGSTSSASSSSSAASSSAGSTSETAAPVDYTSLPVKAEDIVIPGETFTASEPQLNPGGAEGIAVAFSNEGETRSIGDSIVIFPSAEASKAGLDGAVAALDKSIANPAPKPAEVGTEGVVASGEAPDGSKAVTVVTFTQGSAFVVMEFDSAAGDPVPEDFAVSLAQKQAENIKGALG
jgi:hypothetical protein